MVGESTSRSLSNYGLLAAILSVAALILLLAAPFGILKPTDGDVYWVNNAEADTFGVTSLGSLNIMTTGVALAVAGALTLMLVSKIRGPETPRRTFAWIGAMVLTVGAFVALISSALWVGGGMAEPYQHGLETGDEPPMEGFYSGGLTGLIQDVVFDPENHVGKFHVFSPAFVFAFSAGLLWMGLQLNATLAPSEQQSRIRRYNLYSLLGAGTIVAAFMFPWSVEEFAAGLGDTDKMYLGAQQVLTQAGAYQTPGFFGPEGDTAWTTLTYALNTFVLGGFVLLGTAFLSGLMGLVGAGSRSNWLVYPAGLMGLWMLCAFGASWINGWVPVEAAEDAFSPAFWQFAVLPAVGGLFALLAMQFAAMAEQRSDLAQTN